MNSINTDMHHELTALWAWYDDTPTLRAAIITGAVLANKRLAFSAGADLKEWNERDGASDPRGAATGGFAGLSLRRGKKPIIAAVNGLCLGGGLEAAGNTDIIVAHKDAIFALPETSRGVVAVAGLLPRLTLIVGLQRASELALTGRVLTAEEAREWGLVSQVVDGDVVAAAVELAKKIEAQSPDSVIVTRAGLRSGLDGESMEVAHRRVEEGIFRQLQAGDNIKEGLAAFVEKRPVKWTDSKL